MLVRSGGIFLLLLIALPQGLALEKAGKCMQAKQLYRETRQELRTGYSIKRGRYLSCVEKKSRNAIQDHCRHAQYNQAKIRKGSVKKSIQSACRGAGK